MTGKKTLDMILISIMSLSTLAIIGLFFYTEKMYKRPLVNEDLLKSELLKESDARTIPTFFKIDKITVSLVPKNPAQSARMRYVELEVHLVLFNPEFTDLAKTNLALIKDKIITISSKMGADELNSLTGKMLLEDRLKKEINKSLDFTKKIVVKSIFFSHYIVQ